MNEFRNGRTGVTADQPRRFHAHDHFFLDASFAATLPEGGLPLAQLAGPLGPGGPALTFWTDASTPVDGDRRHFRLNGEIPRDAPPGTYRVTRLEIHWSEDSPPSWVPVTLALDRLDGEVTIVVDPTKVGTQPPIPAVLSLG